MYGLKKAKKKKKKKWPVIFKTVHLLSLAI
jgi:hypothetical protein